MIRIAHVLYPVDFSEIAQHAVDRAAVIARRYEARLTLRYVLAAGFGSTTQHVIRVSACPVLIIRSAQAPRMRSPQP